MRFLKSVGEGTFKETFQVIADSGTPLALKLYKANHASPRDRREIAAMEMCNHKNIAKLLSVETFSEGRQKVVALTEEYLSGGTLTSKGTIDARCCMTIGSQLIDALSHIERLHLVHRDIKPDNILFRADGVTPVLTDFGVVRDLSDSSLTPTWAARGPGTPFFSPAEQLNNQKHLIDWRTDQFALGISLAFCVFGQHPFRESGMSDHDLIEHVSSKGEPADWFLTEAIAAGLPTLLKMVSAWPVDRYRNPDLLAVAWAKQKG